MGCFVGDHLRNLQLVRLELDHVTSTNIYELSRGKRLLTKQCWLSITSTVRYQQTSRVAVSMNFTVRLICTLPVDRSQLLNWNMVLLTFSKSVLAVTELGTPLRI
ncbi:hypothetical protein PHMEG_000549 [Phytophthora megakarya]|uniref:Uncharacterized protein n=1 Tax=Phytophthora megakarya TaxID=4795 RepID=A0A225X5A6_9STRA|nr:hypothetical protein PHMEG_000549 [Phytophthora megakarya]